MKTRILAVAIAIAAMAGLPTWAVLSHHAPAGRSSASATGASAAPSSPDRVPARFAGVAVNDLDAFDHLCRCRPAIAVHYVNIGSTTSLINARIMILHGSMPLLELEPRGIPLAQIISGKEDQWLSRFAAGIRHLAVRVILSFGPEANGHWYSWGYHHVAPALFVSAWRHVVRVFRAAGATNVWWAWIMNQSYPHSEPVSLLWPGHRYVDLLGIDGYFKVPGATFSQVFAPTIAEMRRLSQAPLLISETGASPSFGKLRAMHQIVSGVVRYGLAGFIWFDVAQHGSLNRQDWRLDTNHAALAVFRKAARASYPKGSSRS